MKLLLILLSIVSINQVFAGPTQKVVACTSVDYVALANTVESALLNDDVVIINDVDALNYINTVLPQEIGGFKCSKVYYIGPVFGCARNYT